MNDLENTIKQIRSAPETTSFTEVINIIDSFYDYTPTQFINGTEGERVVNAASENEGSCKIFSFARLHELDETQTLNWFGDYYRQDVLQNPEGTDHANIRTFIKHGWQQIKFDNSALEAKK